MYRHDRRIGVGRINGQVARISRLGRFVAIAVLLALLLSPRVSTASAQASTAPDHIHGIGAIGDSYTDEYTFYSQHRSVARNWLEILAQTRHLDFGDYSVRDRGAPRHQGYAYNWSRSDAESTDAIAEGQHLGLARQVAEGRINLAWVFLGGNDFIHFVLEGRPLEQLEAVEARLQDNVGVILKTLRDADPSLRIVLATVPDIRYLPDVREADPHVLDAVSAALGRYNTWLRGQALTAPTTTALLDLDLQVRLGLLRSPRYVQVAEVRLDRLVPGDSPVHFFLDDRRHAGTVAQGLIAQSFVQVVNARFGAGITPLASREILDFAYQIYNTNRQDRMIVAR